MLLTKEVYIKINGKNYKHLIDKGYSIELVYDEKKKRTTYKGKQEFLIKVEDLPKGSHAIVDVLCDYCLETIIPKEYRTYLIQHINNKDCCENCWHLRLQESINSKYKVDNISQLDEVKKKKEEKSLDKYGTKCVLQNEDIKKQIKNTNIEKYGYPNAMNVQEIKDKVFIAREKTLYKNGNAISSTQQRYLHKLFGGELNYPINGVNLDIAFPENKIYIEYDGSGHRMQVFLGKISEKEFLDKERKRFFALRNKGWKVIRIISEISRDRLPSDEKLMEMYEYAIEYFKTGHTYVKFDIDNSKIIISQFEKLYDYGDLRIIPKEIA